ncbi:hypothetical protein [Roseomonas chloroacetimidivorans]|uniref:hypothetical protein n=1 Tax=Roseomonas chloroacetimidivorans TaxID=1766656 RepID=UPI003C71F211
MTIQIEYINSLCGSGKSYQLVRWAARQALAGQNVLVLSPSKQLNKQNYDDYRAANGSGAFIFSSDTGAEEGPVKGLLNHFMHQTQPGQVVFATRAAFLLLRRNSYFHNARDWTVIFDEIPGIEFEVPTRVPLTIQHIRDCLDIEDRTGEYGVLRITNPTLLKQTLALDQVLEQGFGVLANTHEQLADIVVHQKNWNDVLEGRALSLQATGLWRPEMFSGFKRVVIAGANFTDSQFYISYSTRGVEFVHHSIQTSNKLRFNTHLNGKLIKIHYAYDTKWSQSVANRTIPGTTTTFLGQFVAATEKALGKSGWGYIANNEKVRAGRKLNSIQIKSTGATKLPNSSYGHNSYQHLHKVAVFSALNPPTSHFNLMSEIAGITPEQYTTSSYRETVYQTVMRSSARNPDDPKPKTFVVADADTAFWLQGLFPGSTVEPLPDLMQPEINKGGRPKSDETRDAAERMRIAREKAKQRVLQELTAMQELNHANSIFHSKFATQAEAFTANSVDDFVGQLAAFAKSHVVEDKHDNWLITPAQFDTSKDPETKRGKANITTLQHIYLDNDGGDLTHEDFAAMFPKWRVIAYNTFSSTPEAPRYRIIIPTEDIMTVEAYELMAGHIMSVLKRNHYHSEAEFATNPKLANNPANKCHGFDPSKLNAANLMYLPCTNARQPDAAFFVDYSGGKRRAITAYDVLSHKASLRAEIDPKDIAPLAGDVATATDIPKTSDRSLQAIRDHLAQQDASTVATRVEEARAVYQSTPRGAGLRNDAFYRFGSKLAGMGVSLVDIQAELDRTAEDRDRKAQVKTIINSLRRKGRAA